MGQLYSGMLWLTRSDDKAEKNLMAAVEYAEGKYEKPVQLVLCPESESYPEQWRGIPVRGDRRVQAHHVYLVLERDGEETPRAAAAV